MQTCTFLKAFLQIKAQRSADQMLGSSALSV